MTAALCTASAAADELVDRVEQLVARRTWWRVELEARRRGLCQLCDSPDDVHWFPAGRRCGRCAPVQPTARYCAPNRCYCGSCGRVELAVVAGLAAALLIAAGGLWLWVQLLAGCR